MKKKIILIIPAIILLFSVTTYFNGNHKYNENPDLSKKIVGSKSLIMERLPITNMDQITQGADLIVIGKVITSPENTQIEFPFGNEDMKKHAMEKSNGKIPKVNLACSKIKIQEILYGNSSSDVITLAQVGNSESDIGETKVKKEDKMLFILQRHPDEPNKYSSVEAEEALFKIDNNNKTLSLSDNKFTSRYDDIDCEILKNDIKSAKKKY